MLLFVLGSGGEKCRAFGSVRESVVYLRDLFWGPFGHSSPLSPDFLSIVGLFSLNTTSSDFHINSIKTCLTNSWPLLR